MKEKYRGAGIKILCSLFGKTRQAWYEASWEDQIRLNEEAVILEIVCMFRERMPRLGTRKLYHLLSNPLEQHEIKMGRDKLFNLLFRHGMLIKRRKRKFVRTTDSRHWLKKYPNLINGLIINKAEAIWVSDITYIRVNDGFIYLSLVTDNYSKRIMGYYLSTRLDHQGPLSALHMALSQRIWRENSLIHHSDRGLQYCSAAYTSLLISEGIKISMTESGSPYENAVAERINGILKTEFGLSEVFNSIVEAKEKLDNVVAIYNLQRPHASCDYMTPEQAHKQNGPLKKRWGKKEMAYEK